MTHTLLSKLFIVWNPMTLYGWNNLSARLIAVMTELGQKVTYKCQMILLDNFGIWVGIEIPHPIPKHFFCEVPRPAKCRQPIYRFLVQSRGDFFLFYLQLEKSLELKFFLRLAKALNFPPVLTEIRESQVLGISRCIRNPILSIWLWWMSLPFWQVPSFAPHF